MASADLSIHGCTGELPYRLTLVVTGGEEKTWRRAGLRRALPFTDLLAAFFEDVPKVREVSLSFFD